MTHWCAGRVMGPDPPGEAWGLHECMSATSQGAASYEFWGPGKFRGFPEPQCSGLQMGLLTPKTTHRSKEGSQSPQGWKK